MNNRVLFSVCFPLVAGLASSQDLGRKVSFSAPASRASVLIPELGKKLGLDLRTMAQTENEVILIQVHDVTIKDLLDHLATAANAQWKADHKIYHLVRPDKLSIRAEAKEREARVDLVSQFLRTDAEKLKAIPVWNGDQAKALAKAAHEALDNEEDNPNPPRRARARPQSFVDQAPGSVAVHQLLQQIGPEELAQIGPGQRVVFALHPTSTQIPLPRDSEGIIAEFVRNQREYAEAFNQTGTPDQAMVMSRQIGVVPALEPGNPALGIGQAVLIAYRNSVQMFSSGVGLQLKLLVADTNGASLASGSANVFQRIPQEAPAVEPDGSNPISVSERDSEFASLFGRQLRLNLPIMLGRTWDNLPTLFSRIKGVSGSVAFYSAPRQPAPVYRVSAELRRQLLQPETFDPLSFVVGDSLKAATESLHLNLVADLPDSSLAPFSQEFTGQGKHAGANDLLRFTCPKAGLQVKRDDSWVVLSPEKPEEAAALRVDRVGLGKVLRSIESKNLVDLDDLAGYAAAQEKSVKDVDLDGNYLQILAGPLGRRAIALNQNPNALKIYGARTPAQRAAISSNGSISLSSLTPEQVRWLTDDVFNSVDGPTLAGPKPNGAPPRQMVARDNLKSERTQILPNGIRPDGRLTFTVTAEKGYYGRDPETGASAFLTIPEIAARQFQKERPQFGTPPDYKTYQMASKSTITLQFDLGNGVSLSRSLDGVAFDPNSQAVAFNEIGSDAMKEIQDILGRIRSTMGGIHIQSGANARQAPPP